ncbi:SAGA histone acetylase and TREX-2 complexes component [Yamadazyma tenuis]|uniref:Transcription and mRNA export factor SUS1 n=1 Tax=Candida tenuis (strain ATCC 10573 / BCRC 21748 / CBS 615 / JCM 9827 / NBRC 10315 / NRRL Y-1498 / VKM Y-70) TaxID=590646 RepID=G3B108_CANTC|nr:uncharacterized protein CANTEDRAFT_97669 [Yamadazyma tenuis ATCC 10573]EGV64855.1 hypothetical protein CANTEDRAFT_97669 [Yamadazyma tenuis ATCC 10573]WEJ97647.1 SAGA histone acetylase and TREX-2 complexes component [Yamadazyma tenuis]
MTQQDQELEQIKSKIQDHLISSGNYDKINKQLKLQLYESGWYDKISQMALNELQNNDSSNFEQLLSFIKPKAEQMVPGNVREDTLGRIREYLDDVIQ